MEGGGVVSEYTKRKNPLFITYKGISSNNKNWFNK